ncbi:MAG: hypothetical protein QOC66_2408 [Pseudonocardiales bacterium]|nr:hypothetical protein [Pseudonocardiales bacterium]
MTNRSVGRIRVAGILGDETQVQPSATLDDLIAASCAAWDGYIGDGPVADELVWEVPLGHAVGLFGTLSSIGSTESVLALSRHGAEVTNVSWSKANGYISVGYASDGHTSTTHYWLPLP